MCLGGGGKFPISFGHVIICPGGETTSEREGDDDDDGSEGGMEERKGRKWEGGRETDREGYCPAVRLAGPQETDAYKLLMCTYRTHALSIN